MSRVIQRELTSRGPLHITTIVALSNLVVPLLQLGQYAELERLLHNVLTLYHTTPSDDWSFLNIIKMMFRLCTTYWKQGKADELAQLLGLVDEKTSSLPPTDYFRQELTIHLALSLQLQGRSAEAEVLFRNFIDEMRRLPGAYERLTSWAISELGQLLVRQARYDEAIPFLEKSLEWTLKGELPHFPDPFEEFTRLASTFDVQGRYQDTQKLYEGVRNHIQEQLADESADEGDLRTHYGILMSDWMSVRRARLTGIGSNG
jgi:tetratricopeptide (TPR) repeat protein